MLLQKLEKFSMLKNIFFLFIFELFQTRLYSGKFNKVLKVLGVISGNGKEGFVIELKKFNFFLRNTFMTVFLDIEGAYDNISIRAQVAVMVKHGVASNIIKWYEQYLKNRVTGVQAGDIWVYRELITGTPQGGIMSPVVFDYPVDDLLEMCDDLPVDSVAFADDI